MGDGRVAGIRDIVVVEPSRFDRSRSSEAAAEVAELNRELAAQRPALPADRAGPMGQPRSLARSAGDLSSDRPREGSS